MRPRASISRCGGRHCSTTDIARFRRRFRWTAAATRRSRGTSSEDRMNAALQWNVKLFCVVAAIVATAAGTTHGLDVQVDPAKAATVKAAYLLNFLRYSN